MESLLTSHSTYLYNQINLKRQRPRLQYGHIVEWKKEKHTPNFP